MDTRARRPRRAAARGGAERKPPELKPRYQSGFGNEFASEAVRDALPQGRNSPQRAPLGLYAEVLSGTAFTAPRAQNRRTWAYRIRPSVMHKPFKRIDNRLLRTAPFDETVPTPTQLRWSPLPMPLRPTDFVEGLTTIAGNGDAGMQSGIGIHMYAANRSMKERVLYNVDGELLIVPQQGRLRIFTELGVIEVAPREIAVIPRGIRFHVELPDAAAEGGRKDSEGRRERGVRGYVCENYGAMFRLPELGPIGSNGLANARDFLAPVAAYEDRNGKYELIAKIAGNLWAAETSHSPLDVVAWHGNLVPYKYDLAKFMVIGSVSFDHPDPSIFTVLTSASDTLGTANCDFVIFPPRWLVSEDTFRPPWYHRNVMSEFMGLIHGVYDAKAEGFVPGGASLHNSWSAHGPDAVTFAKASSAKLAPHKIEDTMAFMFETRYVLRPTKFALDSASLQRDYFECWQGLKKRFGAKRS